MNEAEHIEELNDPDFMEDDHNEAPPSDVVAYNELRSCADLHRMSETGSLEIKPEFQRDFVWKAADQTRFIDSLVKQLPIPSMCFALDYKTDNWIVIDGLQRMSTINRFLRGEDWKLSKLADIDSDLSGVSAAAIKNGTGRKRALFNRVQNRSLPINVLRCDLGNRSHLEYLFTIFHRLNSGGVKLNNQEIRNCIYGGAFNTLLAELDQNPDWRRINKMSAGENYRFVKQEIILRFFAFLDASEKYTGQVAKFLNDYMYANRNLKSAAIEKKREFFTRTVSLFSTRLLPELEVSKIPTSVLEATMVAVARNLNVLEHSDDDLAERFRQLRVSREFVGEEVAEGLSKKDKVEARFSKAAEIFS